MSDLYPQQEYPITYGPMMECDICDRMYLVSALISIGKVRRTPGYEIEIFLCEECARRVSEALARHKGDTPHA